MDEGSRDAASSVAPIAAHNLFSASSFCCELNASPLAAESAECFSWECLALFNALTDSAVDCVFDVCFLTDEEGMEAEGVISCLSFMTEEVTAEESVLVASLLEVISEDVEDNFDVVLGFVEFAVAVSFDSTSTAF